MYQPPPSILSRLTDSRPRLALGHNQLSTLPTALVSLERLRYLNVRSNVFREFPEVLCNLPSLEILDISRNKIRTLPRNIGNLINLKVLSISKNRIEVLPAYIGDMSELRILKVDHNPVVFPPAEITSHEGGEDSMDAWLANLKGYLRSHQVGLERKVEESDAITTDDEGGETDFNTISKSGPSDQGSSRAQHSSSSSISAGVPVQKSSRRQPPPPIPTKNSHRNFAYHGVNSKSVSGMRSFQPMTPNTAEMERSRSNSESERPFRRPVAMQRNRTGLGTLLEDRVRHSRGYSHDYVQETSEAETNLRSPAEVQQNSRAYFRRLSSLPQSKRTSLNSAKVVEASRGMLFSLSQIHMAIRQYVTFCADPDLTGTINRVLYNANAHVGTLVDALEAHESRPEGAEATPVIEACRACVGAFRHVINILHNRIRGLTSQADVRYTRTLLLLLFGASAEIQNSWNCLNPVPAPTPQVSANSVAAMLTVTPAILTRSIAPPTTRLKSNSTASVTPYSMHKPNESIVMPNSATIPAANGIISSSSSSTNTNDINNNTVTTSTALTNAENDQSVDTDEQLYDKISQATSATLSLLSLLGDAVSKSALASAQGPATPGAVALGTNMKLRDLATNSLAAGEVTRRLKNKLQSVSMLQDALEKRKFWEDTNAFVKAVINVAALAKSISSEYPFSKAILASLSTVTRSTKELTILLSVSSFSQTIRAAAAAATTTTNTVNPDPLPPNGLVVMSNTPLSASLGPALAGSLAATTTTTTSPPAPPPLTMHPPQPNHASPSTSSMLSHQSPGEQTNTLLPPLASLSPTVGMLGTLPTVPMPMTVQGHSGSSFSDFS